MALPSYSENIEERRQSSIDESDLGHIPYTEHQRVPQTYRWTFGGPVRVKPDYRYHGAKPGVAAVPKHLVAPKKRPTP